MLARVDASAYELSLLLFPSAWLGSGRHVKSGSTKNVEA